MICGSMHGLRHGGKQRLSEIVNYDYDHGHDHGLERKILNLPGLSYTSISSSKSHIAHRVHSPLECCTRSILPRGDLKKKKV